MGIHIGIPTWYKDDFSSNNYALFFEQGIEYIELSLEYPWPFWDEKRLRKITKEIKEYDLKINFHLPWRDLSIISPYPQVRIGAYKYLLSIADFIETLDATKEYAVLHATTSENVKLNSDKNILMEITETLMKLNEEYEKRGVNLLLENLPKGPSSSIILLKKLTNKANLGICLDIGHLITSILLKEKENIGEKELLSHIKKWLDTFNDKIHVTHIHGIVKVNGNILEHYLIDNYYDIYADALRKINEKKKEINVTLEIFYRDPQKHIVTPRYLSNAAEKIMARINE